MSASPTRLTSAGCTGQILLGDLATTQDTADSKAQGCTVGVQLIHSMCVIKWSNKASIRTYTGTVNERMNMN
jgi:hypothetical protein